MVGACASVGKLCSLLSSCQVVQRCADVASWEGKRRQAGSRPCCPTVVRVLEHLAEALKESFQPAVAYLMCDATALVSQLKRLAAASVGKSR